MRTARSSSPGPEERSPGVVLTVGGLPPRRRPGAPLPRPGSARSSSSWPQRPSRTLRTSPASSVEGPRAHLCSLQLQGQKVPAPPRRRYREPPQPQRSTLGERMEPWGTWLPTPGPRSVPRRGPGEGTGYSEILWSPLAKPSFGGPFLQWASQAGAEGTAGAGALTPALPPASACLPRDQGTPDGRPTPTKKTQRGKRPGPQQENPQSQAQKKARPSAEASILADARGSVSASDHGTLNPMAPGSCQLSAPGVSLKEAANVVVKCLTPFYKEGKFASKELFKAFARHLAHSLTQDPSRGRSGECRHHWAGRDLRGLRRPSPSPPRIFSEGRGPRGH
uniref:Set2 Rpb1 interacting domain-containing protein n=1 Tax=Sus scrofa TaxID=9823 RepID=A0A8D0NWR9_PIG